MRKIFVIVMLMLFSVSLIACGKGSDDSIETLVVYTNQTSGGRDAKLKNLVKEAGFEFDVLFVEIAGQNLKNRLVAEKNAPIADVVLGGGTIEHLELKQEQVIKPFFPSWLDTIDEVYLDKDGYSSPWAIEPLYLVYNKAHYTNDPTKVTSKVKLAPKDWKDLSDNFAGQYNVFKPSSGTGTTIYASILASYRDDNGELGVSSEGWQLLAKLINGGEIDRGLWQMNLAGSKSPIAMTWAGAIMEIEDAFGVEIGIVKPETGVPVVISQIAVVDSKNEARIKAAEQFVEWWGKKETQIEWAKTSGQAPANKEAFALLDERVKEINQAVAMDLDWQFIVDHISDWHRKIELDIIS